MGKNNSTIDVNSININENVLQGLDNAIKSSFQIKGLLKMNAMLSDEDKNKQLNSFNKVLKEISSSIKTPKLNKLVSFYSKFEILSIFYLINLAKKLLTP